MPYPKLITREHCKEALNLSGTTHDAVVDRVIGWVSDAIQTEAGQPIAAMNVVVPIGPGDIWRDYYDDIGSSYTALVTLKYWPVTAVVSVRSKLNTFGAAWAADTLGDFEVVRSGSLYALRHRHMFSQSKLYEVTLRVGYDIVPGEIQKIAVEMVRIHLDELSYKDIGKNRLGMQTMNETIAQGIVKTTTMLNKRPEWLDIIARYGVAVTV